MKYTIYNNHYIFVECEMEFEPIVDNEPDYGIDIGRCVKQELSIYSRDKKEPIYEEEFDSSILYEEIIKRAKLIIDERNA